MEVGKRLMKVSSILARKGATVWKIGPECSVQEAVRLLGQHGVGALVVEREGSFVGLVTERDILVGCGIGCSQLNGHAHPFAAACPRQVRDVMRTEVATGAPGDELERVREVMIRRRISHLPILDLGKLVGIVSIGDLIHARLNQRALESRRLESYVQSRPL